MIRLKSLLMEFWGDDDSLWDYTYTIDAVEPVVHQVAQQFGETVAKFAGGGSNGRAWVLQSGKVLKLTTDASEVGTALWKKSKPQTKHIVGYYDVRKIVNIPLDNIKYDSPVYAIIMDGVITLTREQQNWYREFYDQYFADRAYSDEDLRMDLEEYNEKHPDPGFLAFWNNLIAQRKSVMADMNRHDIHTGECHAGNVGFDPKNPTQFRVYDTWREKTMKQVWNNGLTAQMREINYANLFTNKPDASGIDTPNNPDM